MKTLISKRDKAPDQFSEETPSLVTMPVLQSSYPVKASLDEDNNFKMAPGTRSVQFEEI